MPLDVDKRDLARLDIPSLIELANRAMEEDAQDRALLYMRTAVRRAPLRQDLRDMLMAVMERRNASLEDRETQQAGPREVPRIRREPIFDEEPEDEEEGEDVSIETAFVRDEAETEGDATTYLRRDRADETRALPRVSHFQRRHERGPTSAIFLGVLTGLVLAGVAGGAIFLYVSGRDNGPATPNPVDLRAQHDKALIELARDYEEKNRFSLAIEQLELLSEGPHKNLLLAEAYARQGDYLTRSKRYNEARDAYEKALEHDGSNPKYEVDLGWTYWMLGRLQAASDREAASEKFDRAELHLKSALRRNPTNLTALQYLADVEFARGNTAAAGDYLRQIIAIDPDSKEADKARKDLASNGMKP